ncbi:MAG: pyridoxamine 5'-phosphate oxidase [Pseudomonadota bacterium]
MTAVALKDREFTAATDPFALFERWMGDAEAHEINDPNALSLATVDEHGMPNVRMVLLKGFDRRGFVFYTNFESQKGGEILTSHKAAMCFHWKSLQRQVRLRGPVTVVSDEEADAYYQTRARGSRIGAWASKQSRPLASKFELEKEVAKFTARHAVGHIARPPHWSGFRVTPTYLEFWQDGTFRLHDRIVFRRDGEGSDWDKERWYP